MIVNWKKEKAGALVVPCVKDGITVEKIVILPGCNQISDEKWNMARGSKTVKKKMEAGDLVEYIAEKPAQAPKKVAKPVGKVFEDFNYNDVVKALKELDMFDAISKEREADEGKKGVTKAYLSSWFTDVPEDWDAVLEVLTSGEDIPTSDIISEKGNAEEVEGTKIQDMEYKEAEALIGETYNLETLNSWKDTIGVPDLRALILKQIEDVEETKGKKITR